KKSDSLVPIINRKIFEDIPEPFTEPENGMQKCVSILRLFLFSRKGEIHVSALQEKQKTSLL
ncbi:MAG: hypothetical protein PHC69_09980, partial [Ruminiclostridium sp.]|nr:hypothetical protein [Ruminiclostridium sp.]